MEVFIAEQTEKGWKDDVVFRLNIDGSVDIIDEGVELCNGMGFSPDLLEFYSTDTIKKDDI